MRVKQKIHKPPEGTKQISVCLPVDLLDLLDTRLDKRSGDLYTVFRSRPAVITAALHQFLTNGTTITLPGSCLTPADQQANA